MSVMELWNLVTTGGVTAGLFIIIYGLYKKWWVPGWYYKNMEKERSAWREIALKSASLAADAVIFFDRNGGDRSERTKQDT